MRENEQTVKIFTLEREHEALLPLIQESFADENIELRFHSKLDTAYDGIFVTQKGFGDIYVFQKDKDKALEILNDILNSSQLEDSDDFPE